MPKKPSEQEEEYFARQEFARKKKLEEKRRESMLEEERKKLKDLHYMSCPKCGMSLIEIDYKGVKIDKCSECLGIWLDTGELESILEMESSAISSFFNIFH